MNKLQFDFCTRFVATRNHPGQNVILREGVVDHRLKLEMCKSVKSSESKELNSHYIYMGVEVLG